MTTITIAAVIPLFNGEAFIREALESVFAQTSPPDEIIVVDDGSTDNGMNIVSELAITRPVTLISKSNGGQSSARNMAVDRCRSSHIALLDQDDIWYPDHLATLRRPFEDGTPVAGGLALVYGNLDHIDAGGQMVAHSHLDSIDSTHPKKTLEDCLGRDMFILPSASLIERQAFLEAGRFDERLSGYEDDDLFLRLFRKGYRSVYINEPVTKWRIHAASTSFSVRMAVSRMIFYRKLLESFPNQPRLHQYWIMNFIAPRFFGQSVGAFIAGSRSGEKQIMERAWADILEIAPELPRRQRKRLRRVAPWVERFYRGPFTGLARALVRYGASGRR
jgi:glycosyltransferase involved in cell wall biosynthesis